MSGAQLMGWVCPICKIGVAPWVTSHCLPETAPSTGANAVKPRGLYEDIGSPDPSRSKSRHRSIG